MKLSQIIIIEANEPDYTGIDDSIRERLSNYKPHEQQWALTELRKGENIESIIDGLKYYRDKIKDNRYQQIMKPITNPINPKSLTQITLQQIKAGQQQYDAKYGGISKRETKKILKKSYAKKLIDEPDLKLIKIERTDDTDGAAKTLTQYAMNTKWCVSNTEIGEHYLKQGPAYYIEYKDEKYLCHPNSEQLMNVMDQSYEIDVGLYRRLVRYIKEIWLFLEDKKLPEYRDEVKYSPVRAYFYAKNVIKGRWPEAEPYIIQKPQSACSYAMHVIKSRWPEAEPIIIEDPAWACHYADVIKGRWPEAEPAIMKNPYVAYEYAKRVIGGRWPEAEQYIIRKPNSACLYAKDVIKARWLEAEQCIVIDTYWAYLYAMRVIKRRWLEAEPHIMKDPLYACYYARDVIKDRWAEAESIIIKGPSAAAWYARDVIKGRWPEAESYIKQDNDVWNKYKKYFGIKDEA